MGHGGKGAVGKANRLFYAVTAYFFSVKLAIFFFCLIVCAPSCARKQKVRSGKEGVKG